MNEKTRTFEAVFLDIETANEHKSYTCTAMLVTFRNIKNNQIFYFTCFQTMTVTLGKLNVHKCVFILLTVR